ncbi:uncharacterized protein LOC117647758 [Thrips palmi]|uniref:Uncharacterized protein LOC117647758 n=1 Tax=Thrips palmi TaxID=161013 RepID=A0A6P8Z5Z1_THRPL|nr:uncharacterized protein LOC117647758 [Thrips palmi]
MFSRPGFQDDLNYKFRRVKKNINNIEDILDGQAYKNAEVEPEVGTTDVTMTWNADGLQVFNSSTFSIWPCFLIINELPPSKRYYSENMLIGGIWCGMSKPHPNIFLQPIYNDLKVLQSGIRISDSLKVRAKLICGTCDAPARAYFLNMKLHSGFYSCHLCLTKGEYSAAIGKLTVFPYEENPPPRTMELYKENVKFAVEKKVVEKKNKHLLNDIRCCGIKGPTVLSHMIDGDLFLSTAIDAMHCVYLGVTRQLLGLWFDAEHRDSPFSAYQHVKLVNQRLLNIMAPHFFDRAPESIDKLVHWKASMLRAFLLYFSVCVLADVLKPKYFEHFLLLVKGISLLNSSSISQDDIKLATLLLDQFVEEFQTLYGKRHMSHNVHMLRHLSATVQHLGPLWIISCFKFEDMNGRIARLIHGTRHAGIQVCSNLSIINRLPLMVHNLTNEDVKKYCLQLRHKGLPLKVTEEISPDVLCVGDFTHLSDDDKWIVDELKQVVLNPTADDVRLFQRLYKNKILYTSSKYDRGMRKSAHVKYCNNNTLELGEIVTFVKLVQEQPQYYAVVNRLQTSYPFQTDAFKITHVHQVHLPHVGIDIVPVSKLEIVVCKIDVSPIVYVSEPLNNFELE